MPLIFVKLQWKGKHPQPHIYYSELHKEEIMTKHLKIGEMINIKFLGKSYCIGTEVDRGEWISCVKNRNKTKTERTEKQYNQCFSCRRTDFFSCRATCAGDFCNPSSEKALAMCTPANTSIYLTTASGVNKVGVSLNLPKRWIEQGSDKAIEIAKAPGLEARKIEQLIAKKYDLKLQVRNSTKIKNLGSPFDEKHEHQLIEIVDTMKDEIKGIVAESGGEFIENPKMEGFEEFHGEIKQNVNYSEVTPKKGAEFGGIITAIKGSILIVDREGYYFVLDLKKLVGTTFEFIEKSTMETQTALDEWF